MAYLQSNQPYKQDGSLGGSALKGAGVGITAGMLGRLAYNHQKQLLGKSVYEASGVASHLVQSGFKGSMKTAGIFGAAGALAGLGIGALSD